MKKLIGIFDTKKSSPEQIYEKVMEKLKEDKHTKIAKRQTKKKKKL